MFTFPFARQLFLLCIIHVTLACSDSKEALVELAPKNVASVISELKFRDLDLPAPPLPAAIPFCRDTVSGSYMWMMYNDTLVSGRAYISTNLFPGNPRFGQHALYMSRVDDQCELISTLYFYDIQPGAVGRYRRMYNHELPCTQREELSLAPYEPSSKKSGGSYFAVADYDLIRSDYRPDTDSLYAPTMIIDSFDPIDSLVTGRFVGRWFKDELCFSTTANPDPDTVVITEGWFQTKLTKL